MYFLGMLLALWKSIYQDNFEIDALPKSNNSFAEETWFLLTQWWKKFFLIVSLKRSHDQQGECSGRGWNPDLENESRLSEYWCRWFILRTLYREGEYYILRYNFTLECDRMERWNGSSSAQEVCPSGDMGASSVKIVQTKELSFAVITTYDSEETATAAQQRIAEIRAQAATEMHMKMESSMQGGVFASS